MGDGSISIIFGNVRIGLLDNVQCAPQLAYNLLAKSDLEDLGYVLYFSASTFIINHVNCPFDSLLIENWIDSTGNHLKILRVWFQILNFGKLKIKASVILTIVTI